MPKGFFITFEGTEGCGKSTQSKLLYNYLKSLGKKVVLTLEPGATKAGKEIRKILLNMEEPLAENTELFLFAADRSQHVKDIIIPAIETGTVVICDRYTDSTVAYQIGGRGLPEELVRYINFISCMGMLPDLTFLLDLSPMVGLPRALKVSQVEKGRIKKIDRFEKEKMTFHNNVRACYLEIAKNSPERIKVIDTEKQDAGSVHRLIKEITEKAIDKC